MSFLMLVLVAGQLGCSEDNNEEDDTTDGDEAIETSDGDEETDIPAEDGDTEQEEEESWPEPEIKDQRLELNLIGHTASSRRYNQTPFPWNYFTRTDDTSLTGLRLDLKPRTMISQEYVNTNMIDKAVTLMGEIYADHANRLNGFSTFGAVMVETTEPLSVESIPATAADSVTDDSLLWLLNMNPASPNYLKRHPFTATLREACKKDADGNVTEHFFYYLHLQPQVILEEKTTYMVVARKGMTTQGGEPLGISEDFAVLCGLSPVKESAKDAEELTEQKTRMAPLFTVLREEVGLPPWDLLLAFDFTTQASTHDLAVIAESLFSGAMGEPSVNLDSSDPADGVPDIYTYETYPSRFTGVSGELQDPSVGGIAHGVFRSTDFRLPAQPGEAYGGEDYAYSMIHDEQDNPVAVGEMDVPFILIYPTTDFPQPFPVVVMQHGIISKKEDLTRLAPRFTKLGIAVMTADFVYHGERDEGVYAATAFINITQPLAAQASFKQAAIDQLHQTYVLQNWTLDAFPQGGDGTPDLDGSKVAYLGHSLGAIVGAISAGINPVPVAWDLNVGGGGLQSFIMEFLAQYGLDSLYPTFYLDQFATLAQTILDQGDGISYAPFYAEPLEGNGSPRNLLLQESIPDETVPNLVTENLARTASLPQFPPIEHSVEGLSSASYPGSQFGFTQFFPGRHELLVAYTGEEMRVERERMFDQIIHFIQSAFETGVGEIIEGTPEDNPAR